MKRTYKLIFSAIAASLVFASCTNENYDGTQPEGTRVITASFDPRTRTYLDGLTPKFNDGDEILVSNGTTTKILPIYVNDGRSLFSTILKGELTAVYPAEAAVVENNVIKGVKVPAEQSGRFADANIAIAERVVKSAHFSNQTALFIITPQEGAKQLTVTSAIAPINTKGSNDEEKRKVTVKKTDSDGKFYVALLSGAKLSDLTFDTGGEKVKYSVAEIEALQTEDIVVTGRAYRIGRSKWVSYVNTIKGAIEALRGGKTAVEITSPTDIGTPVTLPSSTDGKDISISIKSVANSAITFKLEDDAKGPKNLYIDTDAKDLVINCPNSHVEVNGGNYQTVTATTSASTLVVGKNVTIGTLNIKGGNADVYGLVTNVSRASGVKVNWYADSRVKLLAGLEKSTNRESVILSSDIDLNNEDWDPVDIGKSIVFDGAGHTIRNLKIANVYDDGHYGLIGHMYSSAVIRNLTIDGAQILPPASKGGESRGAALVGIIRNGNLENCHVKNVTVSAYQKVGGLVGQLSLEASGTSYVKGCSATNVTISENMTGEGVWGAGGLIGSLCLENNGHNITISGCSVSGISISNSTTEACPQQTAHAFIGTIRGNSNAVVTLSDNTVQQTEGLYTDKYSSAYFGWAPNQDYYESVTLNCKIIIDGTTWEPKNQ